MIESDQPDEDGNKEIVVSLFWFIVGLSASGFIAGALTMFLALWAIGEYLNL